MLRLGASQGDILLQNDFVSAVVDPVDGRVVDFWPSSPTAPTVAQLGDETSIDALWELRSFLVANGAERLITPTRFEMDDDQVVTFAQADLGAGVVEVTTRYTLDTETPRLLIATQFNLLRGGDSIDLKLGDIVKWGNVDYFAEGVGRTGASFDGTSRWVGRHGASGDLRIESLSGPMRVKYRMQHHGMAAPIKLVYARIKLSRSRSVVIQRFLALEPLPLPAAQSHQTEQDGELHVRVLSESGGPLPAKLTLRGTKGTPSPDFGNDGDLRGAGRFAWTGNGDLSVHLPPGNYRALVTSGLEREAATWDIAMEPGGRIEREAILERVVFSPGWVAADLHLHQSPSVDADISLENRVISIAAEGIEYAVASDHYTTTNLAPTVARLQTKGELTAPLTTTIGTEVSTVGNRFGHFNVFPLASATAIPYVDQTPKTLFAAMRLASPRGIIQVNHPRQPKLGYFYRFRMDPRTSQIPREHRESFVSDFDALEVFNGLDATRPVVVRKVIEDWLHLLGRGHHYTATGNSDSHKLFFVDPGMPRNYIHFGNTTLDGTDAFASEAAIVDAIRHGRVVVTTGPMIHAEILGKGPGETIRGLGGKLPLRILVQAPSWIDVDWVEVRVGSNSRLLRWIPVSEKDGGVRLDTTVDIAFQGSTFLVIYAGGNSPLPHLFFRNVKPFAFTNPIWLEP